MKPIITLLILLSVTASASTLDTPSLQSRIIQSFDADWKFLKADAPGADKPDFSDTGWKSVDVPHDWSIEGPFDPNATTKGDGGFLPSGVSWYRKHFTLPGNWKNRQVFIEFDGVMANSQVWLNGKLLGSRPFGYVSFRYELTPYLTGKSNVLAVRTDTTLQPASRWYTGSGIYRHVRLIAANPIRLDHWSVFVSTPHVAADTALVRLKAVTINQSETQEEIRLKINLFDPEGRLAATAITQPQSITAGASLDFQQDIILKNPRRWDIDTPVLYTAHTQVYSGQTVLDDEITPFGIREFHFEPTTGFWLNGRNVKLKGVCLHHDGGAFGAAVPLRVWQDRLETLKQLGANAIRTAHNPADPEFLDLCDRMGFLVMDEFLDVWTVEKRPGDYHRFFKEWATIDTRDTVRRDRNHPCIILYSAGNEIHDTPKADMAKGILKSLIEVYHQEDPTRPVTQGLFRPNVSHDYDNGLADMLDVVGQNYRENEILAAYKQNPSRKIIGTENRHDLKAWLPLRDNPPYAGQFLWTGIDYLGESRQWPAIAQPYGLIDRTGATRPRAFQRQSWWSDRPMVHITRRVDKSVSSSIDPGYENTADPRLRQVVFSDWTPTDLDPHEETVEVYSNCRQVELLLNGRSLGTQSKPEDDSARVWKVAFEPGQIEAIGYNGEGIAVVDQLNTAGKPAGILLTAGRTTLANTWDDVARIQVSIVDENGALVPNAKDRVDFTIIGPGRIAAVDNSDNSSHELFQTTTRSAYQGRCYAWVKATKPKGTITLTAAAPGLKNGTITLTANEK
jgi:beta-galactosidase